MATGKLFKSAQVIKSICIKKIFVMVFFLTAMFLYGYQVAYVAEGPVYNEMVRITGGTFTMGSPENEWGRSRNEGPQRQVTVSSFYIGRFPVTQAEFEKIMGRNPSLFRGPNLPVEQVSWFDAIEFSNRRSVMAGPDAGVHGKRECRNLEPSGERIPAAHRSGMGICLPRGRPDTLWRRNFGR